MPKKRLEAPRTPTEQELFDALERLKDNKPTHPALIRKARLNKLSINPTTVADEAGRSRTLIGHDKCAYPRVREAIMALKSPADPATSFEDINRTLRTDNTDLRTVVKLAMSRVAAMALRMEAVEKEATRRIKQAGREAKNQTNNSDSNEVAGAGLRPKAGKVLQLPSSNKEN